jgi:hypothetical protein
MARGRRRLLVESPSDRCLTDVNAGSGEHFGDLHFAKRRAEPFDLLNCMARFFDRSASTMNDQSVRSLRATRLDSSWRERCGGLASNRFLCHVIKNPCGVRTAQAEETPALQNNVVVPGILEQEGAEITEHFPSVSSVSSCSTSYREHV